MAWPILSVTVKYEQDVVSARQRARQIAEYLGFDRQDQTRIATAVSEIARNAYHYAHGGRVEFQLEGETAPQLFLIRISDRGPGIADLERVLSGQYQSPVGMGIGLIGARRLMDQCEIDSAPQRGTTVWLKKLLPRKASSISKTQLAHIAGQLAEQPPQGPLEEVHRQNQELLRTLAELRERQEELTHLNRELEDTNRGVVALYAELDEKADHLRRADEMKSRFLSNMSHEFRTPLNSILALSHLLLDRGDGPLNDEQEKQVAFIRKSAEALLELVNDLLDLAKIEAGKIEVRPIEFTAGNLFSALRGMLRPLLVSDSINLIFEEPQDIPPLYTDEGKVSQILRNFISNALKFTERGEIRVKAALAPSGEAVVFSVADTGIGIAREDQSRIFEDFTQLENALQRRVRGTGLGLPLCRRLTMLLGGTIEVQSEVGTGSIFKASIPLQYQRIDEEIPSGDGLEPDPGRIPVLLVEDDPETRLIYQKYLRHSRYQLFPARSLRELRQKLAKVRPRAIILDILLHGEDSWHGLAELKGSALTKEIPILVATTVEDERKGLALGANAYCIKPVDRSVLLAHLDELTSSSAPRRARKRILLIDDEESARYVFRKLLGDGEYEVLEAAEGETGLRLAREHRPDAIFLDLNMPGITGEHVLHELRSDPATCTIPIVIITAQVLDAAERQRLLRHVEAIVAKDGLSRETIEKAIPNACGTHRVV
jgi:signal transduction histidine kinase/CheY-like chemotaxis protein